ncbi:transmembrane protease serine 11C-like [Lissotriton helveticus]
MTECGLVMKQPAVWKILLAFVGVLILLFLAVAIPLIIVFVVFDPTAQSSENRYFSVSFKITNANFLASFEDQSSSEYRSLSSQIESLLNTTYKNSDLKKQYIKSQVVKLSPGSVVPQFVVLFANTTTGSGGTFKESVQETLLQTIQTNNTGPFNIDPNSLQLHEITNAEADNLLHNGSSVSLTVGCGQRAKETSSRIVGGTSAKYGDWPWQASLLLSGYHKCGATLVSDSWLVTAAHCFDWQKDINVWTVRLGTIELSTGNGLRLKQVIIYPGYTSLTHENDIALLCLSEPVRLTWNIRPVCLPEASEIFPDDSICFITGWGALGEEGNILLYRSLPRYTLPSAPHESDEDSSTEQEKARVTCSMLSAEHASEIRSAARKAIRSVAPASELLDDMKDWQEKEQIHFTEVFAAAVIEWFRRHSGEL